VIDRISLDNDMGDYTLLLEDSFGTHHFHVDPDMLLEACQGYVEHLAVGESVRADHAAYKRTGYLPAYVCPDPEGDWIEMQREQADLLRKRVRENPVHIDVDPGDEDVAA
jgi:hypothetical protein